MPLSSTFKLENSNVTNVKCLTTLVVLGKGLLFLNQLKFLELYFIRFVVQVIENSLPLFLCTRSTAGSSFSKSGLSKHKQEKSRFLMAFLFD